MMKRTVTLSSPAFGLLSSSLGLPARLQEALDDHASGKLFGGLVSRSMFSVFCVWTGIMYLYVSFTACLIPD